MILVPKKIPIQTIRKIISAYSQFQSADDSKAFLPQGLHILIIVCNFDKHNTKISNVLVETTHKQFCKRKRVNLYYYTI